MRTNNTNNNNDIINMWTNKNKEIKEDLNQILDSMSQMNEWLEKYVHKIDCGNSEIRMHLYHCEQKIIDSINICKNRIKKLTLNPKWTDSSYEN